MKNQLILDFVLPHHGAKNLINKDLSAVEASQFELSSINAAAGAVKSEKTLRDILCTIDCFLYLCNIKIFDMRTRSFDI